MGKPKDPAYWRKYRAAHPSYRERERKRSAERRAQGLRGDRSEEYRRRAAREREQRTLEASLVVPPLSGHPIIARAHEAVLQVGLRPSRMAVYLDPLYEEAVMSAALAVISGDDPVEAARATIRAERSWRYRTAPLIPELIER